MQRKRLFHVQTVLGQPVTGEHITVTPQSQAFAVRLPWGGLVFGRPIAILVERDGTTRRFPIVDVTRLVQLSLLGFCLIFSLTSLLAFFHRKEKNHDRH